MVSCADVPRLPVIDLSLFDLGDPWRDQLAAQIDAASSEFGFFCLIGHGIDLAVVEPLLAAGQRFFAAEAAVKRRAQITHRAHARQEHCALVETLVARSADPKRLYFETRLTADSEDAGAPAVASAQTLVPDVPDFPEPVLDYMRSLTGLSHKLMAMIARGLRQEDSYFVDRWTGTPATSLRILNYPQLTAALGASDPVVRGHAERGLLTILIQDPSGGLELGYRDRWIECPFMPNSFICSVGHALAQLTNGRYLAAPYRLSNSADTHRLSMSFCFEPALNAELKPIAEAGPTVSRQLRNDANLDAARASPYRLIGVG
jgi:isopenicillin N synthase-like dioxygenase